MTKTEPTITTELLKDVLKRPDILWKVDTSGRRNSKIFHYSTGYTDYHQHTISLWEVYHRCKKWAWDNGFIIESSTEETGTATILDKQRKTLCRFTEEDEIQAVIAGCEWIKNQLS